MRHIIRFEFFGWSACAAVRPFLGSCRLTAIGRLPPPHTLTISHSRRAPRQNTTATKCELGLINLRLIVRDALREKRGWICSEGMVADVEPREGVSESPVHLI